MAFLSCESRINHGIYGCNAVVRRNRKAALRTNSAGVAREVITTLLTIVQRRRAISPNRKGKYACTDCEGRPQGNTYAAVLSLPFQPRNALERIRGRPPVGVSTNPPARSERRMIPHQVYFGGCSSQDGVCNHALVHYEFMKLGWAIGIMRKPNPPRAYKKAQRCNATDRREPARNTHASIGLDHETSANSVGRFSSSLIFTPEPSHRASEGRHRRRQGQTK